MKRELSIAMCALAIACKSEDPLCQNGPEALELTLKLADPSRGPEVGSLVVTLGIGGRNHTKTFELGEHFKDGETSIPVVIDPRIEGEFDVTIGVDAHAASDGAKIGRGEKTYRASSARCNRTTVDIVLGAPPPEDGGVGDAAEDAGDVDGGEIDGEVIDGGIDGGGVEDTGLGDTGLGDTGPLDTGTGDTGPPPPAFPYAPSNFDPTALVVGPDVAFDCGRTTFDSENLMFMTPCAAVPEINASATAGSPVVLAMRDLTVANMSTLVIIGDRPVILAVFGTAQIAGVVDASANHEDRGAGGSDPSSCMGATGGPGGVMMSGGGGGGGAFGTDGALGGEGARGGEAGERGNQIAGGETLVPLRGGCGGGRGGDNSGRFGLAGAGGGGVQISAAALLRISGDVIAAGGGGGGGQRRAGGGGGGSGGGILLEADSIDVPLTGHVVAPGGGGGEAGGESSGEDGADGEDGSESVTTGGDGGNGRAAQGGEGGQGGFGAIAPDDGIAGATGQAGGGGGGGAVGKIRINANVACLALGVVSPRPSTNNLLCGL